MCRGAIPSLVAAIHIAEDGVQESVETGIARCLIVPTR
jgi:hypothetical protein